MTQKEKTKLRNKIAALISRTNKKQETLVLANDLEEKSTKFTDLVKAINKVCKEGTKDKILEELNLGNDAASSESSSNGK